MKMRKLLPVLFFLIASACQQKVAVPTAQELITNPQLYAEWEAKCDTGKYSHLSAAEKDNMCSTTNSAGISLSQAKAGKAESDFFKANTLRK